MSVRIESPECLSVGDRVDHDGAEHVVTDAVVWTDAWGVHAHTAVTLELVGGDDEPGETGDQ